MCNSFDRNAYTGNQNKGEIIAEKKSWNATNIWKNSSLLQLQILKFEILKCAICKKIVAEECEVRPHKKMNISLDNRLLITLTKLISLDLTEVELPEEAVDAGLLEASFFSRRLLSIPFSRGEWVGLARGEEGS